MLTTIIITAIISVTVAIGGYLFIRNVILKKKKEQIIIDAEKEGEDIKKEKIFQAKEKFLQLKVNTKLSSTNAMPRFSSMKIK